jgi:hypothetical protein
MLSIISGTGAAIWLKINVELTKHHYSRSSNLQRVCTVPALLQFCKYILEVVLNEGVQQRLEFCLDHLNFVKMTGNIQNSQGVKSWE